MAQQANLRRNRRATAAQIDTMPLEEPGSGGGVAADEIALVPHPGADGDLPELPSMPTLSPPSNEGGGPIPSFPVLTEEVGYPPSPLAGGNSSGTSRPGSSSNGGFGGGSAGRGSLGPMVTRALQDVLGWKIKPNDAVGFMGALNQSFTLTQSEGTVVTTWTPRSYAVQSDLSGGISGAQASIYTMAKTMLDQILPLLNGLYPLDPAANTEDVTALKQLVINQLTNLTSEMGYLGGPRVMRVHQYLQMLLGVRLELRQAPPPLHIHVIGRHPPQGSPLAERFHAGTWPPVKHYWTSPDLVLGSLGNLRDMLGLFELFDKKNNFINTVEDEQNVTNFRVIVDYVNSVFNAWSNSIQFFAGVHSRFLGTQLVIISRQLGVVNEAIDEVRFVLDSVFIGPAQRETTPIHFHGLSSPVFNHLPTIFLEDLLQWAQNFVATEAPDVIQNGGKLGIGEDFMATVEQLYVQTFGLYLYAQAQAGAPIGTARVQQGLYKLVSQFKELFQLSKSVELPYAAPRY
jgi:hypothetical protein